MTTTKPSQKSYLFPFLITNLLLIHFSIIVFLQTAQSKKLITPNGLNQSFHQNKTIFLQELNKYNVKFYFKNEEKLLSTTTPVETTTENQITFVEETTTENLIPTELSRSTVIPTSEGPKNLSSLARFLKIHKTEPKDVLTTGIKTFILSQPNQSKTSSKPTTINMPEVSTTIHLTTQPSTPEPITNTIIEGNQRFLKISNSKFNSNHSLETKVQSLEKSFILSKLNLVNPEVSTIDLDYISDETQNEKVENLGKESDTRSFEGSQKITLKSVYKPGLNYSLYTPRPVSGKYLGHSKGVLSSSRKYFNGTKKHEKKRPNMVAFEQTTRRDHNVVSLLGLFELSTRFGERPAGRSELAAAKLAVKHINELNLLPGYTLELLTNDTKCDPGVGVDSFFHALYTQRDTRMVMLLGSACSEVTESLAKVVPYWNIVQVSFGSTSPLLSDRTEFPLFYRTVAPDSSHNPARIAFVTKFGWDTVTVFSQNEDVYSLAINDLVTELERSNITCTATITFAATDFKDQMKVIRDMDTRIIIGSFSYKIAPKIFCEAFQLGMYGADYAWILQGGPDDVWWINKTIDSIDCTSFQLAEATNGLILVSSHNSIVGTDPSLSGLTNEKFAQELEKLNVAMSQYAPQTYDAVWAIALALAGAQDQWRSSSTTLTHFDYTRKDMAREFLEQLASLNFSGISGPVSFSGSDRIGTSAFHQVQDGEIQTVALFYPATRELDFECVKCTNLQWTNGQVPIARRVFKIRVVTIAKSAFLAISILALTGIILAIGFLIFNLHFRKLKSIKLSSPRLNNMAAVGCILVYAAVILLGLDHATLQNNVHFRTICTARVYLLSAGFSMAFGSMFTKTYRVHHIFTRSRSGFVKNKLLQDTQLILMICVLLLMDGFIVTLWLFIDPMQRDLRNLPLEISSVDRSVVYQPQVEVCISRNINGWLGALYVYKGLLLIVGVYMAWETRHVKIPALNDSEYIGMSVYSVVITTGIVVVLANLMTEQPTLSFLTITILILISTTTTLCLLFLPKIHAILGGSENVDPIVESMGLKIEYNTRRFVTDDKREKQHRVEVQNRVYQREVAALDLEIGRLEKLLVDFHSTSTSSSTSSITIVNKNNPEVSIIEEPAIEIPKSRTSISGTLPLLLLSVLPPVIPRASWPSADYSNQMRRSVTFSSERKLVDDSKTCIQHEPVIDLLNLRIRHDPSMLGIEKPSVLERIKNFFEPRKSSAANIAAALKVHMGYIAGLVPGTKSCNTSSLVIDQLGNKDLFKRHSTHGGPCTSGFSDDRKFSLREANLSEPHVNFDLPAQKISIIHQQSQPILPFRERAKGSPRFPHKIVPTCSLTALEDRRKSCSNRRTSNQPKPVNTGKWRSMEDATFSMPLGMRRGSGILGATVLPVNTNGNRASSYSPNCDVWATAEFGIPLSEFNSKKNCAKTDNPPDSCDASIT